MINKKWVVSNKLEKTDIDKIVKILLKERGLKKAEQIDNFLNPIDPYTIQPQSIKINKKQIQKALTKIQQAIESKKKIIIYGDYDADGICATAILWETLYALKAKVLPFIPHREKHGYGLNQKGIDDIIKDPKMTVDGEPLLIITVDNGIVANQAVDYACQKGIEVIVTDHHQAGEKTPQAEAIIHSTETSGAAVAWLLAKEVYKKNHQTLRGFKASNSLELACIGTITDIMPLQGINRSIVSYGLKEIKKSNRPGIKALCNGNSIQQQEIESYHLGYIIGPRLNAMGRLENALESLRILCTKKTANAEKLAGKLNFTNRQRQQLTETTFKHALKKVKKDKIIFAAHQSYNQGIVGLVAGKLQDKFYRPAIVISKKKKISRGSARSIKGFNIIKTLRKFKNLFEDVGGHPMAAGFTIKTANLKKLEKKLIDFADQNVDKKDLQPIIEADLETELENINWKLYHQIEKFAPFGFGNKRPRFVTKGIKILQCRAVGRNKKHLKLKLITENKKTFNAIGFNLGELSSKISSGDKIDILYTIFKNVWNGNKNLELKIKDIKKNN